MRCLRSKLREEEQWQACLEGITFATSRIYTVLGIIPWESLLVKCGGWLEQGHVCAGYGVVS
jgi:hypothetical protein